MSDPKSPVAVPALTTEQFQDLFVGMAKEIRRPADPTPEQQAELDQAKQMRAERGALEKQKQESRRLNQSMCDHSREDGTAGCVPVYDNQGAIAFLICQANQCIIHHGSRPTGAAGKDTEHHIYDTQMFNRELRRSSRRPAMVQ